MSMSTYNLLKKHFMPELLMSSIFILQARILKLSHVTEVSYNCCINTCCCFARTYTALDSCPFCKHTQYNSEGHLYKKYKYLPIEPHIKAQRDGGTTCWPLIALNFNLPPDICMWLAHIIPLSIIPGPKAPKDFNLFLHPFVDECKKLAAGVWAFDSHENKTFKLHVYLISVNGDMMAIKYVMNFKVPNGKSLCHVCHITADQDMLQTWTPFYVPLTPPHDQHVW